LWEYLLHNDILMHYDHTDMGVKNNISRGEHGNNRIKSG